MSEVELKWKLVVDSTKTQSLLVLDNDIQVHACLREIKKIFSNDLGMLEESKL